MQLKKSLLMMGISLAVALPSAHSSAAEVTIKRDKWGVPHVYADTRYDLFYGYGYAVAQDRLYQMEMAKRSTQGRVAEVLGRDFLEFDKKIRQNFDPVSIQRQIAALEKNDRDILSGYAAGMNAWISKTLQSKKSLLPKQFHDNDFEPELWTDYDVAMIFVGSMGNRFGDYNTELANQQLVDALIAKHGEIKGKQIFNQLNPLNDPSAPTTIPKGDWKGQFDRRQQTVTAEANEPADTERVFANQKNPLPEHLDQDLSRVAIDQSGRILALNSDKANQYNDQQFADYGLTGVAGYPQTSNMIVVGKSKAKGANSILLNGPQFGWYNPAYTYSVGLHGADFDLVGNTPFAYPAILFGHNKSITWGSTWGAGDLVDIYRETLNPNNANEYRYKSQYWPYELRTETIKVKGGGSEQVTVKKSIHGLVVSEDIQMGVAYSKKRSWQGRELDTLFGWIHQGRAENHSDWLKQAERMAFNINWYYADQKGNIGYVFTGKYPERVASHDNRLPASGDGDQEWLGLKSFAKNPQVYNPSSGYIANWNNKPADDFLAPDMFWYSWSKADRVDTMTHIMDSQDKFTADDVKQMMEDVSYADVNAKYFIPYIDKATAHLPGNDPVRAQALRLISWDQQNDDRDKDGYYDSAASAVFQSWLPLMLKEVLKDDLPEKYFPWYASAGYPSPESPVRASINVQPGVKALLQAMLASEGKGDQGVQQDYDFLNGKPLNRLVLASFKQAVEKVQANYGNDPDNWKLPVVPMHFFTNNFLGVPQAADKEAVQTHIAMNRGTENNLVVFSGKNKVKAYEVVAPGQSGFIAPDGTPSPHYQDQLSLYENFDYKETWLNKKDVKAHTRSTETINSDR
ncbi:penicillin acylase family protein [Oceanospirillum sanctuarii]|uniref:penicillin acylase family protein n=1 Tax=Oceanospirillum sanctuarii TaxID=1434821 RepID=UPI001FE6EEE6|nr:penicillin acylase family protein [Oceanospirillum sanctuarii]